MTDVEVWRADLADEHGFYRPFTMTDTKIVKETLNVDSVRCDDRKHTGFNPDCDCGIRGVTDVRDLLNLVAMSEHPVEDHPWMQITNPKEYFALRTVISRGVLRNAFPCGGKDVLHPIYPQPSPLGYWEADSRARQWLEKPTGFQYEGEPPSTWKAESYELTGPVIIGHPKGTETTAAREAIRARIADDVDCHWLDTSMLAALRRYDTMGIEREQWWNGYRA